MRKTFILSLGFIAVLLFLSLYAHAGSISFSWGKDQKSDANPTVVKAKSNGPPEHAPAHGYRAKRQYKYYPSASVYHDAGRGLYFYLSGTTWKFGATLPHDLRIRLGSSVSIELDTDRPYIYYDQHRKQYRPGQMKKTYKKKGKKWTKK
jgi:hypothetical protein